LEQVSLAESAATGNHVQQQCQGASRDYGQCGRRCQEHADGCACQPGLEFSEVAQFQAIEKSIVSWFSTRYSPVAPHNRRRVLGNGGRIGRNRGWLLDTVG